MRTRYWGRVALLAVLACSDPGEPRTAPSFTLAPLHQWSGGTVMIRSRYLAADTVLPVFLTAEGVALVADRINDTSAAVTLPVIASGPLHLIARRDGYSDTVGTVQVYGFAARTDLAPIPSETYVLGWSGANPMILGGHDSFGDTVVVVDPVAGTSVLLPSLRNPGGYYGLGVTYRRDQFVARDASDTLKVWQLWPVPSAVALPPAHLTDPVRLVAQMTDSTWLFAFGNTTESYGPGSVKTFQIEDPWNLFVSPRGDRLAMTTVLTGLPGAPVFDTRSGDTAYTMAPVQEVRWADFAPDGTELYVLWNPGTGSDSILVLDATTGSRRRSAPAGLSGLGVVPHTLAVDPVADLLYVQGSAYPPTSGTSCGPSVVVRSASTLERLGEMSGAGAVMLCGNGGWPGIVAVDRPRNRLYVLWNGGPLWTFDLIP